MRAATVTTTPDSRSGERAAITGKTTADIMRYVFEVVEVYFLTLSLRFLVFVF